MGLLACSVPNADKPPSAAALERSAHEALEQIWRDYAAKAKPWIEIIQRVRDTYPDRIVWIHDDETHERVN